jgi:phosphatidate phosphatase APP1
MRILLLLTGKLGLAALLLLNISEATAFLKPGKIKADEHIVFFPGMAHLSADRTHWIANVHGWVFEKNLTGDFVEGSKRLLGFKRKDYDKEFEELKKKRLGWFFVDNQRNKKVSIQIQNKTFILNKSGANGHFYGKIKLPSAFVSKLPKNGKNRIAYTAVISNGRKQQFTGEIFLIPPRGISVISDIDDTIKLSEVYNKRKLMENTFKHPYKTIPGMARSYRRWDQHKNINFHYLTASPWQLYVPLDKFMDKSGFPKGTFHMRYFRLKDSSFFNIMKSSQNYKEKRIHEIVRRYPKRRFILVGDSGERDYHIYTKVAEKYPGRIRAIFIHETRQKPIRALHKKRYAKKTPPCPIHIFDTQSKPANLSFSIR